MQSTIHIYQHTYIMLICVHFHNNIHWTTMHRRHHARKEAMSKRCRFAVVVGLAVTLSGILTSCLVVLLTKYSGEWQ